MIEVIDTEPQFTIQEEEYNRLLGYPSNHRVTQRSIDLSNLTRKWYEENGKPWVYARKVDDLYLKNGKILLGGFEFNSQRLYSSLNDAGAGAAMIVVVSAGKECELQAARLWMEGKPDEYFFMEMLGSAVVENLITMIGAKFCAWADENQRAILPHYSPGYPEWDISEQGKLMDLLLSGRQPLPGNIKVLETGMLNPKKSLLAVFGITTEIEKTTRLTHLIPCENCSLTGCQYRRRPYSYGESIMAEVNHLHNHDNNKGLNGKPSKVVLEEKATYSINSKVLRKWADERLTLTCKDEGDIEAKFRFEGTTCSNLGQPLNFDYFITLSAENEGFTILNATCKPAPGDDGHKSMCEYIKRHRMFLDQIKNDSPLVSKPLNEVLTWSRQTRSTGCFCDPISRLHKWGLVLEVLHYALANRQKEI